MKKIPTVWKKNYIDKHYNELYECNSNCPGFTTCKNVEEIK